MTATMVCNVCAPSEPASRIGFPMSKNLQILLLEDVANDAELITEELRRGGLDFSANRVEASDEFLFQLKEHPPDLVLSDHGIPSFDGFTVLSLVRDRYPEVPFIFVTGHMNHEEIVKAFEQGANDCVLKGHLGHLVPAVRRALRQAAEQRKRKQREIEQEQIIQQLRDELGRLRTLNSILSICASCKKIRDTGGKWVSLQDYIGAHLNISFSHGVCPSCAYELYGKFLDGKSGGAPG